MRLTMKVKAYEVKEALSKIHTNDFFITECKNGGTFTPNKEGLYIFDGVAIKKSWTKPKITIYEVKVDRSDFLRDVKYHCYLPYCHELYLVTPKGLIKKEEIPTEIGLMYYYPESGAIKTVKKAIYGNIEINANMLMYIIMNKMDSDRTPFYSDRKEFAEAYIKDKADKRNIGYTLGSKLAKQIAVMNNEIYSLKHSQEKMEILKKLICVMKKHGIDGWYEKYLPDKLDDYLSAGYPPEIDDIQRNINSIQATLTDIKNNLKREVVENE